MDGDQILSVLRDGLFTAVVGDVMDTLGLTRQFLPPEIRPLHADLTIAGRAMPVHEADIAPGEEDDAGAFGLMFKALDDLKAGEVYICAGASPTYALWGGLMSTRAQKLGAAGAVMDGYHRDTREITALSFPVFSRGGYAQDQRLRGRVVDFRQPIVFANGCRVAPGDIVFRRHRRRGHHPEGRGRRGGAPRRRKGHRREYGAAHDRSGALCRRCVRRNRHHVRA